MQQHPIPQNVTQYQFRLVGDMTLKQFLELAIGLVLAYLFYASNLIFIFKWPLVILSLLFGAGLAFFPLEDRPLDQWIINFIKAIYAPTRFIWQKTNKIPPLFLFTAHPPEVVNTITKTIKAPTTPINTKTVSDLSDDEVTRVSSLDSLFATLRTSGAQAPEKWLQTQSSLGAPTTAQRPSIVVRKLKPAATVKDVILHTPVVEPTPIPKSPSSPIAHQSSINNVIFTAPSAPSTITHQPSTMSSPKKITLPASPKSPNLVTGVVVDKDNKLIENAIVQIVSGDGIPARAMKTNSLGQFYTSTPLGAGTYVIEVDKTGLSFSPQQITVNNSILSPIELRASS
ncbi:MAG: PrgI family protein [bacterium]